MTRIVMCPLFFKLVTNFKDFTLCVICIYLIGITPAIKLIEGFT